MVWYAHRWTSLFERIFIVTGRPSTADAIPTAGFFGARGKKSAFRSIDDGTGSGKPVAWPVSLINNVDPCFHPPTKPDGETLYSSAEFPRFRLHSDDNGFNEWVAHFLALCMKVRLRCACPASRQVSKQCARRDALLPRAANFIRLCGSRLAGRV